MGVPPRSQGSARIQARRSFIARRVVLPAQGFLHTEGIGSALLLAAALVALGWANSPWQGSYDRLWQTTLSIDVGIFAVSAPLREWINDGLMAVFFFVVGMEIKREWAGGELSRPSRAALPIAAALGGMITPAMIYLVINPGGPNAHGWGVPMATDIAFAVGVLLLLGDRVPDPVRIFLLALAIADDVGAILVIAVFYAHGVSLPALVAAVVLACAIFAMQRLGIRGVVAYLPVALGFWVATLKSGIHATIAGVVLGVLMPTAPWFSLYGFSRASQKLFRRFRRALDLGDFDRAEALMGQLEELSRGTEPPLDRRLRLVHPWSSFVILPVFALANAGVRLSADLLATAGADRVAWGVVLGLVLGKPLGILALSWLAVRLRLADLPTGATWSQLLGAGILAGIGFTVSLFMADLAFEGSPLTQAAKAAILAASVLAGIVGYTYLRLTSAPTKIDD